MKRLMLLVIATTTALGCKKEGGQPDSAETAAAPAAATATTEQFVALRWLEGDWRGAEGSGAPFFERYRFVNDSTIAGWEYGADSTFAPQGDSGLITLRGGTIRSGENYVATAVAADSILFAPVGRGNSFVWRRDSDSSWTATLRWRNPQGEPQQRTYNMRRTRTSRSNAPD